MNDEGWFIGPNGEFLLWVPSYLRPSGLTTDTKWVIAGQGKSWLDVTHLIHVNGQEWQKIKERDSSASSRLSFNCFGSL